MSPEDTHTGRVESGHPDALGAETDNVVNTLPHFPCRLVGKGDCQNVPRIHAHIFNQVCDSSCEHTRFP